ncbi:uncharacterized protein LOC111606687 [Xiphophorus maculatus]|uniref:uncharacterized protein LOC111606687 n=1 Tax=Xiphophorus maculatus TaxID=8083 RepID=UPI000C6E8ACC|nr:uncharacterized protein LOC111606687 [Xiphophorus maculatus]
MYRAENRRLSKTLEEKDIEIENLKVQEDNLQDVVKNLKSKLDYLPEDTLHKMQVKKVIPQKGSAEAGEFPTRKVGAARGGRSGKNSMGGADERVHSGYAEGDGGLDVFVYGQADKLRNFVAGIFIPQYHYPFPVALCFTQVLVSLVFINLLHALGLVHLRPYSRSLGERLLLPAICNSVHSVLMTWAKASSPYANLFLFTVPLLPLLTLGFSFALKVASLPSHHLSVLISILSGMFVVITASNGIPVVESLEYLYAPLALILHSLSLITFAKVSESVRQQPSDVQPSVFDIYYAQLVIQSGVLGFLWLLHPDKPWLVLKMSSWRNLLFHGYLLAIVLLGMVLNFLVCTSTLCVSPLAAALLYSARYMVQPFFHLL